MKFLTVFCVVLCVQSGAFLHIQNNVPDISYQNQEGMQVSADRSNDNPINNPYDNKFRNQPIRRFSEQFNPQKNEQFEPQQKYSPQFANSQQNKNTNEKLLNEENYPGNQGHYFQDQAHPMYLNPPARRFNEAQYNPREVMSKPKLQENMRLESSRISPNYLNLQQLKNTYEQLINQEKSSNQGVQHFSSHPENILPEAKRINKVQRIPEENISGSNFQFSDIRKPVRYNVLPQKPVYEGSAFTNFKNINSQPIKHPFEQRHTPVEDITLELQAVSPEYIKLFTNADKTEKVNSADVVRYSDNKQFNSKKYFERNEATYENPSAEVLYSTKRALPYEIEERQIPKISQGSINFNKNADSIRIQDIRKLMQPSKRYMIIHPDGRVEHIDEIEKITKTHPNYVMINSQDFLKHIEGRNGISGLQIPQYAQYIHDSIVNQKRSEAPHHLPDIHTGQRSASQFVNNPLYTKVTDSVEKLLASNEPKVYPTQVKTVIVNTHISPENSNGESQLLNKDLFKEQRTHLIPDIENHEKNNNIRNEQTIRQLTPYAKENEFKNIELTSGSPSDIKQIQSKNEQRPAYGSALLSSTIATITEKYNDDFNKSVITKLNKTQEVSPFVSLTLKDNLPIPPHDHHIILNNESEQHDVSDLLVPKISTKTATVITDNNIKNISQAAALNTNTNKTDIGAIQLQNSTGTISNGAAPNITQVFYKNPETLQDINHEISDTLFTASGPESGVISIRATTASAPITNEISLSKNNQEENINKNGTNMPELNVTSPSTTSLSNTENTTNNTGFWFQADEQFWHNIMSKNDTQNLFYFFFVPPKTNIMQRETKTTLYPNGTTIEEVSETIDEDGVPKVIKTTTVFVNSTSTDV